MRDLTPRPATPRVGPSASSYTTNQARRGRQDSRLDPQARARINLPVYLDADVQAYLAERANARGIEFSQLVNQLLKKDIELIEAGK
jgi:hypothetical protein